MGLRNKIHNEFLKIIRKNIIQKCRKEFENKGWFVDEENWFLLKYENKSKSKGAQRSRRFYHRHKNNLIFKLNNYISRLIWIALKKEKNYRSWKNLVGYDINELKKHLEKQFTPEMNWDNYGKFWEIDHKIPKSWFKFEKAEDEEFKKCWALKNLQPLEVSKNRSKNNHFTSI